MWCPSATLSVWTNAWLAGQAAPDDVLDALSLWAARQSVAAHDAVAAGSTGLPWPHAGAPGGVSLLQTLRGAAKAGRPGSIHPVAPVPGDVRGLPPGTPFEHEALAAGEAVIVAEPDGRSAVGLIPDFGGDDLAWTVYALPDAPTFEHADLGGAEYALRAAVRSAADTLGAIGLGRVGADTSEPRLLIEELVESSRQHRIPDHAPARAVRVLDNASYVDAIISVSSGLTATGVQSLSEMQRAADAMRPLAAVVRSARAAAVDAVLHSAWGA